MKHRSQVSGYSDQDETVCSPERRVESQLTIHRRRPRAVDRIVKPRKCVEKCLETVCRVSWTIKQDRQANANGDETESCEQQPECEDHKPGLSMVMTSECYLDARSPAMPCAPVAWRTSPFRHRTSISGPEGPLPVGNPLRGSSGTPLDRVA